MDPSHQTRDGVAVTGMMPMGGGCSGVGEMGPVGLSNRKAGKNAERLSGLGRRLSDSRCLSDSAWNPRWFQT